MQFSVGKIDNYIVINVRSNNFVTFLKNKKNMKNCLNL